MGQIFTYAPLEENEIRLLKILPGEAKEVIAVTIEHFSLENLPPYTALSYTWNKESDNRVIKANDHDFIVQPNLEAALRCVLFDPNLLTAAARYAFGFSAPIDRNESTH
jgi:hypothetical protein